MSATGPSLSILMTIDAVGGVWRYAMDLGCRLRANGVCVTFLGFGPEPDAARAGEARAIGDLDWSQAPLDWMAGGEADLAPVAGVIAETVRRRSVDLVHLNLPSQAASLDLTVPVVTVSHSCVTTWFHAVRSAEPPDAWRWQADLNRRGFAASRTVVAPSHSHAALLRRCYGTIPSLRVVRNGSDAAPPRVECDPASAVAVGRWWDDGKNAATLDAAAALLPTPVRMIGPIRSPSGSGAVIRHAESVGELGRSETLARISAAGVFISPSIYEPFGLAVTEAARAGRPLVLSDIQTFRELWEGAALFFPPDDPRALARAVLTVAGDRALAARLGAAARRRSGRYTLARQAGAMLAVYAEACRSPEPALAGA